MHLCFHHLLERNAEANPGATAVVSSAGRLTYRELNGAADGLAVTLGLHGARRQDCVAFVGDRSMEIIVALFGNLKAGTVHVPILSSNPDSRIAELVARSQCDIVLCSPGDVDRVAAALRRERDVTVIPLVLSELIAASSDGGPSCQSTPMSSAYMIFTSGSTGEPKGVVVPQSGLTVLGHFGARVGGYEPRSRVVHWLSPAFDGSMIDVVSAMSGASTLYLPDSEQAIPGPDMARYLRDHRITHLFMTPSALSAVPENDLPDIRFVGVGGGVCSQALVDRWARPGRIFLNAYGPTETTVMSTAHVCKPGTTPTIGHPVDLTRCYVLDEKLKRVPAGRTGELFISGQGVALGYLGDSARTAERFLPDPFSEASGARMYRTGDVVYETADGELQFVGRTDDQVKVRGIRVECGEVRAAVTSHPDVIDAVVVPRPSADGSDSILSCYLTMRNGAGIEAVDRWVRGLLPSPLIPSQWFSVAEMPLTDNGKVDLSALAQITASQQIQVGIRALSDDEGRLARIWFELLKVEVTDPDASFFGLGGTSLMLGDLRSRMRTAFGRGIALSELYAHHTLEAMAARVRQMTAEDGDTTKPSSNPVPRSGPATDGQTRLWLVEQSSPGHAGYIVTQGLRFPYQPDTAALQEALRRIVAMSPSLRTVFRVVGDELHQIVRADGCPVIRVIGSSPDDEVYPIVDRLGNFDLARPFDLGSGPLFELVLVRSRDGSCLLVFRGHHIIIDGWSMSLFWRRLLDAYSSASPLPDESDTSVAIAMREQEAVRGPNGRRAREYWAERLRGVEALSRPSRHQSAASPKERAGRIRLDLDAAQWSEIVEAAQHAATTPFAVLLACFEIAVAKTYDSRDFVVGVPHNVREDDATATVVGFHANTVPMRGTLRAGATYKTFLKQVAESCAADLAHGWFPFGEIDRATTARRSSNRAPLFRVMFAYQDAAVTTSDLLLTFPAPLGPQVELFGEVLPTRDGVIFVLHYDSSVFTEEAAARIVDCYQQSLDKLVRDPDSHLTSTPESPALRPITLIAPNSGMSGASLSSTIGSLDGIVTAAAARWPNAIALIDGDLSVDYAELSRLTESVAVLLQERHVRPGDLVAISIRPGWECVVAMLGVLRAGAGYVPVDPAYPRERVDYMLTDSAAGVMLVCRDPEAADAHSGDAINLASVDWASLSSYVVAEDASRPEDPVYAIYTSGSTGWPKGVLMPRRAALNLVGWQVARWNGRAARTLHFTSLSFDVSFQELMATFATGGTVVVASQEVRRDPQALLELIEGHRVERAFMPFIGLQMLADTAAGPPTSLTEIVTAGEQLQLTPAIRRLCDDGRAVRLFNQYGPSETHVVTEHEVTDFTEYHPPIGRPVPNITTYVLDDDLQPVPVGEVGELYIGGDQIALGYMHRTDLTADRFLPDPHSARPGARLYRTGDSARLRPDGALQFLGRQDDQIKVRGYRLELAEIESVLSSCAGVRASAVHVFGSGIDQRLVAFVVLSGATAEDDVRAHCARFLPALVVPDRVVALPVLPTTPSGKIDRTALALPETKGGKLLPGASSAGSVESGFRALLGELLLVDDPDMDADFFAIGGHSLLAVRLLGAVRERFGVVVTLRDLLKVPTGNGMAAVVARLAGRSSAAEATPDDLDEPSGSPLQADLAMVEGLCVEGLPAADRGSPMLVTGATGFLGAHLVEALLSEGHRHVWCLVRASGAVEAQIRLRTALRHYGISDAAIGSRVHAVRGDLGLPRFGMSEERFRQLADTVGTIVHAGANVGFLYPYQALRAVNVVGTAEVLKLAATGTLKPVWHVSTVGVCAAATPRDGSASAILEGPVPESGSSVASGYIQTKWVAEKLVERSRASGVPATVLRPGRITGHSVRGSINPDDFIARLLAGCSDVGMVPELVVEENLLPVDSAAASIAAMVSRMDCDEETLHVLAPATTCLGTLLRQLVPLVPGMRSVPFAEWHAAVLEMGARGSLGALIPFIEDLATPEMWREFLELPALSSERFQRVVEKLGIELPLFDSSQVALMFAHLENRE